MTMVGVFKKKDRIPCGYMGLKNLHRIIPASVFALSIQCISFPPSRITA